MLKLILWVSVFCLSVSMAHAVPVVDIEKIYDKQCATCHGNNGDGNGRAGASLKPMPTDFTSPLVKQTLTADKIVAAIRSGVAGTSMVGYERRLNSETIQGLSDFIQARFMGIVKSVKAGEGESSRGKELFIQHCAVCHGDNGSGAVWAKNGLNPAPRDFTSQASREELSRERMIISVTYGRAGTAMMPFTKRLSENEIEQVVDYIRQQFIQVDDKKKSENITVKPTEVHAQIFSNAFPDGLIGDVEKGRQFFESNCYVCHGKKGDGNGPRADFNMPRPRDFTTSISQQELDRPRLFHSISKGRQGSVMPAWSTVLSNQQIADVAEYVYQTFLHPQKKKP